LAAYIMPLYAILDIDEIKVASSLFPAEMPTGVNEHLGIDNTLMNSCNMAVGYMQAIRL